MYEREAELYAVNKVFDRITSVVTSCLRLLFADKCINHRAEAVCFCIGIKRARWIREYDQLNEY